MTTRLKRFAFWGVLALIVVIGLVVAFRPVPVAVDSIEITRGDLIVTVNDEGEARVHDVYVLSSSVAGRMRRIELHPGDSVVARETIVAEIEPIDPAFLDPRSEAQARADVRAAESAEALARAGVDQAEAELEFAARQLERAEDLIGEGTISQRELDEAERAFRTRRAALATAVAALDVRVFELERARATLLSPAQTQEEQGGCACVSIRAPVNGQVLRVLQQSEGVVAAGTPLVEIGNSRDLEIVVDVLSSDAVSAAPGQRVMIDNWGGNVTLNGRVRTVEPYGFTKVSALGIEEQRVNVVIDLTSPPDEWLRLAHGYQVDARIVVAEVRNAALVPLLALFRDDGDWAVFVERDGRAELRHIVIGAQDGLQAELVQGVEVGERVILHPSDRVQDGVRVTGR
jgi:HlyD family secretion protein